MVSAGGCRIQIQGLWAVGASALRLSSCFSHTVYTLSRAFLQHLSLVPCASVLLCCAPFYWYLLSIYRDTRDDDFGPDENKDVAASPYGVHTDPTVTLSDLIFR